MLTQRPKFLHERPFRRRAPSPKEVSFRSPRKRAEESAVVLAVAFHGATHPAAHSATEAQSTKEVSFRSPRKAGGGICSCSCLCLSRSDPPSHTLRHGSPNPPKKCHSAARKKRAEESAVVLAVAFHGATHPATHSATEAQSTKEVSFRSPRKAGGGICSCSCLCLSRSDPPSHTLRHGSPNPPKKCHSAAREKRAEESAVVLAVAFHGATHPATHSATEAQSTKEVSFRSPQEAAGGICSCSCLCLSRSDPPTANSATEPHPPKKCHSAGRFAAGGICSCSCCCLSRSDPPATHSATEAPIHQRSVIPQPARSGRRNLQLFLPLPFTERPTNRKLRHQPHSPKKCHSAARKKRAEESAVVLAVAFHGATHQPQTPSPAPFPKEVSFRSPQEAGGGICSCSCCCLSRSDPPTANSVTSPIPQRGVIPQPAKSGRRNLQLFLLLLFLEIRKKDA